MCRVWLWVSVFLHACGVLWFLNIQLTWPLFCFAPGAPSLVAETWDPSTVTIAVLSPGRTRRPTTRHLSQCSQETARLHMNAQTNHGRLSDVCSLWSSISKRGTNFPHTRFMCRSSVKIASHEPTEMPQSSAISSTVYLLLLRTTVLTLAIISSFLDVDGRPERGSLQRRFYPL